MHLNGATAELTTTRVTVPRQGGPRGVGSNIPEQQYTRAIYRVGSWHINVQVHQLIKHGKLHLDFN